MICLKKSKTFHVMKYFKNKTVQSIIQKAIPKGASVAHVFPATLMGNLRVTNKTFNLP